MNELLSNFLTETNEIVKDLEKILDHIEDNFEERNKLNDFALLIDRIMGSSQSLACFGFDKTEIHKLGNFSELCKQIGYRGANLEDLNLYNITIAFLMDAVESIKHLLTSLSNPKSTPTHIPYKTFIGRLEWIIKQYNSCNLEQTNYTEGTNTIKSNAEIENLIEGLKTL